jgi:hypothetical protein
MVLGGKVFKDASGEEWPLHAWSHMMAIYPCYFSLMAERGTWATLCRNWRRSGVRLYRVKDKEELYCALERTFVEAGELEKCTCCRHEVTFTLPMATVHGDVVSAYSSLWGTPPAPWLVENPTVPHGY